ITAELFGVRYERISDVPVWHESVETYDVYEGPQRIGRFYLDLHPRKDKYTHAAASILVRGTRETALPQAALMCNFPDPKEGPAPRHAAAARPGDPVPRILRPRPGGPRDDGIARGDLPEVPARAVPSGDALPMQLRAPERLLRDLLHVHVVPRHREGPVLEIPG